MCFCGAEDLPVTGKSFPWHCAAIEYGVLGPLLRDFQYFYESLAHIAGSMSDSGVCWTPTGLPFVTDCFYNFYGQNFKL